MSSFSMVSYLLEIAKKYLFICFNLKALFTLIMSLERKVGKVVFGKLSLDFDSLRQVSRTSFHSILAGQETATLSGWHTCVVFGGRQMKRMFLEQHSSMTVVEK